jgi:hypothetical protein
MSYTYPADAVIAVAPLNLFSKSTAPQEHRMHMLMVITGGVVLLGLFLLFGRLWGGDAAGLAAGAKWFIPVWLAVSMANLWVGVTHAGYSVREELPIGLLSSRCRPLSAPSLSGNSPAPDTPERP